MPMLLIATLILWISKGNQKQGRGANLAADSLLGAAVPQKERKLEPPSEASTDQEARGEETKAIR